MEGRTSLLNPTLCKRGVAPDGAGGDEQMKLNSRNVYEAHVISKHLKMEKNTGVGKTILQGREKWLDIMSWLGCGFCHSMPSVA